MIIELLGSFINTQPVIDIIQAAVDQVTDIVTYIEDFTNAFIPVVIWYGIFKIVMQKS